MPKGNLATILEDIVELRKVFELCSFSFVHRTGNQCSYMLAQYAVKLVNDLNWENHFPVWLTDLAQNCLSEIAPFCN